MKNLTPKLIILLALILFLIARPASATNLNLGAFYSIYESENLEPGRGLKLSADLDFPIYPWLSVEKTLLRFGGQEMADMEIYGVGLGMEKKWWFVELGYYVPRPELKPSYKEALWLEINRVLQPSYDPADHDGNDFRYKISPDFGVSLGVKSEYQLIDSLRAYFSIMYRWMKFEQVIICQFPVGFWEIYGNLNFSGPLVIAGVEW